MAVRLQSGSTQCCPDALAARLHNCPRMRTCVLRPQSFKKPNGTVANTSRPRPLRWPDTHGGPQRAESPAGSTWTTQLRSAQGPRLRVQVNWLSSSEFQSVYCIGRLNQCRLQIASLSFPLSPLSLFLPLSLSSLLLCLPPSPLPFLLVSPQTHCFPHPAQSP